MAKKVFFLLFPVLLFLSMVVKAQSFGTLTTEDGLMDNSVTAIYQDGDGLMYLGSYQGVIRFDGQHVVNIPFPLEEKNEINYVTAIASQDNEHLLVGNDRGLWQLDKRHLSLRRIFNKEIDCGVSALQTEAVRGSETKKVIIKTLFGVYSLIDNKLKKISNHLCALPRFGNIPIDKWGRFPKANCVFVSADGIKWASYSFFGVDYTLFNRGIFHVFEQPGTFNSRQVAVRNFLHDSDRIFFCTREGLFVYDSTSKSYYPVAPEVLGSSVVSQIVRIGEQYLVGTIGQGFVTLDRRSLRPQVSFLQGANVYQLCDNGHGTVWISSSQGVGCFDSHTGKLRMYNMRNSQLPSDETFCLCVMPSGNVWISTSDGLCVYSPFVHAIVTKSLPNKLKNIGLMRSIESLSNDRLLLIPQHGLPSIYEEVTNKLTTIPLKMTDNDNSLLYLKIVNDSSYIFVTSNGIYVQQGKRLRKFGYIDGLSNQQFQSHAVTVDTKGVLWAATNSGLVYAQVKDLLNHTFSHQRIIFGQIQTDHWFTPEEITGVMMDNRLKLSRYRSDFTVQFSPVIYGRTSDIQYRYRLIGGADESWHTANYDHILSFHHLAAGSYRLEIEAIGMPEIAMSTEIIVPFTYTAIILSVFLLLLFAFIGYVLYCKYRNIPYFWKMWERKPEHYRLSKLSPSVAKQLQKKLLEVMENDKPYLNPALQMSDLSKAVGCTSHELSQVFSQYLQRNYYDFIAEYRIKEFERLATKPKYSKYTITALSELCGFRSRTPFLTAFKKFTGKTPKDYMKELGQ